MTGTQRGKHADHYLRVLGGSGRKKNKQEKWFESQSLIEIQWECE